MDNFLLWFLIPFLTILIPGHTNWFTSNFSVVGSEFPQNIFLLLWAMTIARFYHSFTKRTIGQANSFLKTENELAMTDLSACLLVGSVLLPYQPDLFPFLSMLHLIMAFSSTVVFYTTLTIINVKFYVFAPDLFAGPLLLLLSASVCSMFLLILCNFLISSALEIFLTLFSCIWLQIFDHRIQYLLKRRYLKSRMR